VFIGIDIGRYGGVGLIDPNGTLIDYFAMTDYYKIADRLEGHIKHNDSGFVTTYVEDVGAMPKQGVSSMFTFGRSLGSIEGLLIGLRIPYQLIKPKAWQKVMYRSIDRKGCKTPKERAFRAIRQLYPTVSFVMEGCRVEHDGVIDALLIACAARRLNLAASNNKIN